MAASPSDPGEGCEYYGPRSGRVDLVKRRDLQLHTRPLQKLAQQCGLCKQDISSEQQMPLNAIIIEAYSMCPNCRQRVSRETENACWYPRKWLLFVQSVAGKNGWEYRAGARLSIISALRPDFSKVS